MFKSIKKFFGFGDSAAPEVKTQAAPSAPYNVPAPALVTPIPLVVEAIAPVAPVAPVVKPVKPKAVKKPAAPKAPAAPAKPKAAKITAKAKTLKIVK